MMRARILVAAIMSFALLAAPSCATGGSELDDTSWLLESYGAPGNLTQVIEDTNVSLDFVRSGHRVTGSTGCNAFDGGYEIEGNALTIDYEIGSGQRCDLSAIVEQEQRFLSTFVDAESYTLEGDTLTITCEDRVLVFNRR